MSSHHSSPSYQPLSPPWSRGGSPPAHYVSQPRAPVMPYKSLPVVDFDTPYVSQLPHRGLIAPPSSSAGSAHPLLCASPTIIRYDLSTNPRTLRMSSSVGVDTFPTTQPASFPPRDTINIECDVSGQVITIRNERSAHGITCADVFVQLHAHFAQPLSPDEWRRVPEPQRGAMKAAFGRRTAHKQDSTMRLIDYLQGQHVFKRLIPMHGGRSSTPRWLLQTAA